MRRLDKAAAGSSQHRARTHRATHGRASASSDLPIAVDVSSLETPLGDLVVAASPHALVATSFNHRTLEEELAGLGYEASPQAGSDARAILGSARSQLDEYFSRRRRSFDLPINLGGQTPFARAVLEEVAYHLPFGTTATYGEIGERAGRFQAARAVGNIMAACPFAVIVPCHRVVHAARRSSRLGPVGGFPRRKRWLLEFESSAKS